MLSTRGNERELATRGNGPLLSTRGNADELATRVNGPLSICEEEVALLTRGNGPVGRGSRGVGSSSLRRALSHTGKQSIPSMRQTSSLMLDTGDINIAWRASLRSRDFSRRMSSLISGVIRR